MKITVNDYANSEDIEIVEYLEPQCAFYTIKQGESEINFINTSQVQEVIKALKFIIDVHEV